MMVSAREYFVRLVDEQLVVTTVDGLVVNLVVCTVDVRPWIDIEDHRAWHVEEYGLQVAHGLLLHHCALGRGMMEAKLAAAYWRRSFYAHVLLGCIGDVVHLTDVFLNAWLVERILDELRLQGRMLSKMRSVLLSQN